MIKTVKKHKKAVKKYKYRKDKKRPNYDLYLRFEKDIPKKVILSSWDFSKDDFSGALFKSYVCKEDGVTVDKIWSVWDFNFSQLLKKKLAKKSPADNVELNVVVKENDDGESYYEFAK